jgi:fermentation-respiration switch protein FrsA (DUF1100 family)
MGGAAILLGSAVSLIDAVILEAVYPDIQRAIDNRVSRWIGPFSRLVTPLLVDYFEAKSKINRNDLNPIQYIGKLKCPVLILSGEKDQHTTLADTKNLFSAAHEPKEMQLFPGAGHVALDTFAQQEYQKIVLGFFGKSLRRN